MEVSFKGFKNAGVQKHIMYDRFGRKKVQLTILNCELTNNGVEKDLDSFKSVFSKSVNQYNPKFLNLGYWQHRKSPYTNETVDLYFINGDEYKVHENNLGFFEKIAQLLKKIIVTKNENFQLNSDYLSSADMYENFIFSQDERENSDMIGSMHAPENVKSVAEFLLNKITDDVEAVLS